MAKATQTQINQWKKQYGDVFAIAVPLGEAKNSKKVTGYFRKPDLATIGAAAKFRLDPIKSGEIVFENTWLGGDEEIRKSDELKLSVLKELGSLFKVRQAKVEKL